MSVLRRTSVQRGNASSSEIPENVGRALDQSADDLRHDRIEDSVDFLKRMRARIEAYFQRRNVQASRRG
jgi:hypothetical protein